MAAPETTRTAPWPQPHHASLCSSAPLLIGGSARAACGRSHRTEEQGQGERRSSELFYPLPTTSPPLETARHMHMHAAGREQRNRAGSLRLLATSQSKCSTRRRTAGLRSTSSSCRSDRRRPKPRQLGSDGEFLDAQQREIRGGTDLAHGVFRLDADHEDAHDLEGVSRFLAVPSDARFR